ncbi:hypothetical protein R1flu_004025 [Riccia fluitans]|uniref:Uncharacterized protein n=1 Tax=Riccia fluitans TaxID=41844 RepID=A0ABD1YP44_9MARC
MACPKPGAAPIVVGLGFHRFYLNSRTFDPSLSFFGISLRSLSPVRVELGILRCSFWTVEFERGSPCSLNKKNEACVFPA